ncbi:CGNR zinc finger domain-containing protein [Streptomyces sp. URMC 123]|uniref:CGNR zinc finger domain-containing protein n=1 Tax=Streptomyces sp. URMC 123 TaxID=3423403 RepID=UPI003F197C22
MTAAAATASPGLRFDAGRPCLDLAATATARPPQPGAARAERLDSPERLRAWLRGAGLVPPGTPLDDTGLEWLVRFRALRELLHRVIRAELTGRAAAADIARLNAVAAAAAPPAPCAVRAADGSLVRAFATGPGCAGLLAAVARDAVELLTDPVARGQLRQCEGDSCSLLYLDTSRGRRRRWCSSEVCGNRERVARHRRRAVAARG